MSISTNGQMTLNAFKAWLLTDDAVEAIMDLRAPYEMTCPVLKKWLGKADSLKRREQIARYCMARADKWLRQYRIFVEETCSADQWMDYIGFRYLSVTWDDDHYCPDRIALDNVVQGQQFNFGRLREDFPDFLSDYQESGNRTEDDGAEMVRELFERFLRKIKQFRVEEELTSHPDVILYYSDVILYLESLPCAYPQEGKYDRWFVVSVTWRYPNNERYGLNYLPWAFGTAKSARLAVERIAEHINMPASWERYKVVIVDGTARIIRLENHDLEAPEEEVGFPEISLHVEQILVSRSRLIPNLDIPPVANWLSVRAKNWDHRNFAMCQWLEKLNPGNCTGETGAEKSAESDRFARMCDWWKFVLTLLQPYEWPLVLRHRPDFAEHCQCWGEWNDVMWCVLLRRQPQFADRFTGLDDLPVHLWCFLLRRQPQFAARFNKWNEMDAHLWVKLLKDQPQFASHCDWEELNGYDWIALLKDCPDFAHHCSWGKLDGSNWVELLKCRPEFVSYCDWGTLDGNDWVRLLSVRPEFSSYCDWEKLYGFNWVRLLVETGAEFAGKCDKWGILSAAEWCELLGDRPDFSDRCDWSRFHWDELSEEQWMNLIDRQSQFIEKADSSAAIWRTVSVTNWKRLLNKYPNLRVACERQFSCWEGLSVQDFLELISLAPGLVERCDWAHQWTADEQVEILKVLPAVRIHICFDKFSSKNWVDVLAHLPALAEKCDWNIFTENEAASIVSRQHHLINFVPQGRIVARRPWIDLSLQDEAYKKRYLEELNIGALDGRGITDILLELPEFIEKFPTNKIVDEIDKKRLATMQVELAARLWGGGVNGWSKCYKWKGKDGIILGVCVQGDLFSLPPDLGRCDAIIVMEVGSRSVRIHSGYKDWIKRDVNNRSKSLVERVTNYEGLVSERDVSESLNRAFSYFTQLGARSIAINGIRPCIRVAADNTISMWLGSFRELVGQWFENNSSTISVVYLVDKDDANAFD